MDINSKCEILFSYVDDLGHGFTVFKSNNMFFVSEDTGQITLLDDQDQNKINEMKQILRQRGNLVSNKIFS